MRAGAEDEEENEAVRVEEGCDHPEEEAADRVESEAIMKDLKLKPAANASESTQAKA